MENGITETPTVQRQWEAKVSKENADRAKKRAARKVKLVDERFSIRDQFIIRKWREEKGGHLYRQKYANFKKNPEILAELKKKGKL